MDWIFDLKKQIPFFLENLKSDKREGFYHYSLSGDYFGESIKWGLGNSVFFLKIIYTLGLEREYAKEVADAIRYVKSFQAKSEDIFDPLIHTLSAPMRVFQFVKNHKLATLRGEDTIRAESRQAISALKLFDSKPDKNYTKFASSAEEIDKFLKNLNWKLPWSAGSHFSHLLFFIEQSNLGNKRELIDFSVDWLKKKQNLDTGCWYDGQPSPQQIINGAMKVMTGLKAVGRVNFSWAEKIVDFCLKHENNKQACDNFNITYVLKYCNEVLSSKYRHKEIIDFVTKRLNIYKEYYYPKLGGFSFFQGRANKFYYGAPISRGKNEPDIHGTVLFLWGISLISQVLGINDEMNFKEFIT